MRLPTPPAAHRFVAALVGLICFALVYSGCAGQPGPSEGQPPGGGPGRPPGPQGGPGRGPGQAPVPQLKNIKVLKNVPAAQMIPLMREWSHSLGVRCDHCHIEDRGEGGRPSGFEKDGKPQKETARKMFVMMQDLNAHQKVVDGKVSCFMCHHGQAQPEGKAPEGFGPGGGPGRPGGFGRPGIPVGPGGQPGTGRPGMPTGPGGAPGGGRPGGP
jgi:hypothetical protein